MVSESSWIVRNPAGVAELLGGMENQSHPTLELESESFCKQESLSSKCLNQRLELVSCWSLRLSPWPGKGPERSNLPFGAGTSTSQRKAVNSGQALTTLSHILARRPREEREEMSKRTVEGLRSHLLGWGVDGLGDDLTTSGDNPGEERPLSIPRSHGQSPYHCQDAPGERARCNLHPPGEGNNFCKIND